MELQGLIADCEFYLGEPGSCKVKATLTMLKFLVDLTIGTLPVTETNNLYFHLAELQ